MSLGPADEKMVGAFSQGESPADAPDKVLATAFLDCIARKEPNSILAVSQDAESSSSGGAGRSGREDSYCIAWSKALSLSVLSVGRAMSTHALFVGFATTGPHRFTCEMAKLSQICTRLGRRAVSKQGGSWRWEWGQTQKHDRLDEGLCLLSRSKLLDVVWDTKSLELGFQEKHIPMVRALAVRRRRA